MRLPLSLLLLAVFACGGATNEPTGTPTASTAPSAPSQNAGRGASTADAPKRAPKTECASSASVIAKSGTAIRQPVGSVQRFQLVYQGSEIGVTSLRGVDMIIGGSDGPLSTGTHSGYWAEVRDASGKTTFTRVLEDPTRIEGPGDNGGFTNATLDECSPKLILVDVPRSPAGSVLVIIGMPYGARGTASELARFTLE